MARVLTRARDLSSVLRDQFVVAVLYAAAALIALRAPAGAGAACPIWPSTAIAFVAVLRRGPVMVLGVAAGVVITGLLSATPAIALGTTVIGSAAEPLLAVWLFRRFEADEGLRSARDIGAFVAAVSAGAMLSAMAGIGGLQAAGVVEPRETLEAGAVWALGNVVGAVCLAPLLLVPRRTAPVRRGAAGSALLLAGVTVALAGRGLGPFADEDAVRTLLGAQLFILVATLSTLVLGAIADDWRRAAAELSASEAVNLELIEEQAALRRVATAVAEQRPETDIMRLVAREVANLADVECGTVVRHVDDSEIEVAGQWMATPPPHHPGQRIPVVPGGPFDQVRLTGDPARFDERHAEQLTMPPWLQRVAAPVTVDERLWGVIIAATTSPERLSDRTEARLGSFAQLVATAIVSDEQRERLRTEATTDPLTGLLNHRAFHEALRNEVARASRHGRDLAVAAFDIDHFKRVNDTHGHAAGDALLRRAAERLRQAARAGDQIGRLGGDEIAVIMPEVSGMQAFRAADRLREAIAADDDPALGHITASAGTCDLSETDDPEALLRRADGALYWAKAHGRNTCVRYMPGVIDESPAEQTAERLSRERAVSAISALARAVDAKDPMTTRHSERVAELAAQLAQACRWEPCRIERLREAGLVHDVGKLGISDAVLCKSGRLSEQERDEIRRHAELGAQIASQFLDGEQADWIRSHHERIDGTGYPRGLCGSEIPDGARLLSLADAWDVMTRARPYGSVIPADEAFRECHRLAGTQFCPEAIEALAALWRQGRLAIDSALLPGAPR